MKISTSKLILGFLLLIGIEIIIFTEAWTWHTGSGEGISTLVGISASMIAAYIGYLIKSLKENTSGGIVYDMAIKSLEMECLPSEEEFDEDEEVEIIEEEENE